jgi:thiol-disulfide isomerase/thioredoxin
MTTLALVLALLGAPKTEAQAEPILLDFHASWCGPCRQMRPAITQLINKGYPIQSYDIDQSPAIAQRYRVSSVPTFIIVDRQGRALARTQGLQPAVNLATLYQQAKAQLAQAEPAPRDDAPKPDEDAEAVTKERPAPTREPQDRDASPPPLPRPWETVVRIKVLSGHTIGFGSGTVIHSTDDEALILTCAHIFHIEGAGVQPRPAEFPYPIVIELFDGRPVQHGRGPATVHFTGEALAGKAVDYDFAHDVGLIRVKTNRKLPAARVVPANWRPQRQMEMITVGCSEGRDATAWSTYVLNPSATMQVHGQLYEAIECAHAPRQGRSGGGLFTLEGYVAGVCDFAEPAGNHGLYAAPRSIHRLLDRNNLMALYEPRRGGDDAPLVAQNANRAAAAPRRAPADVIRAQSPDRATERPQKQVTLPKPELLGIAPPQVAAASASNRSVPKPRAGWRAAAETRGDRPSESPLRPGPPLPIESRMVPAVDDGPCPPPTAAPAGQSPTSPPKAKPSHWRAVRQVDALTRRAVEGLNLEFPMESAQRLERPAPPSHEQGRG